MSAVEHPPKWKTLLAFGFIYFVWGSTYLAIRVGVHEVPPLMLAGMRFFAAGAAVYGWTRMRGERAPSAGEWISACVLAFLIFVCDYGLLFWAEIRVPSGIAAVMMATIPVFIALGEIVFLGTQKLTGRLAIALVVGIGGVAVLTLRSLNLSGMPVEPLGAAALIVASISWAVGTVLMRKLELPPSKVVSSGNSSSSATRRPEGRRGGPAAGTVMVGFALGRRSRPDRSGGGGRAAPSRLR